MTVLTLDDVSRTYPDGPGRVTALSQVSLSVDAGEFVAVMGPSGSGKTTLLNLCAGLERPESGLVFVNGVDISRASVKRQAVLRRQYIGVLEQEDDLDPLLRVVENVALPLILDGVRRSHALSAATHSLERCGAESLADRYRDQLSGGQRQWVALSRAIVGERHLVLADEPTGALDTSAARKLVQLLVVLASEGSAILMTTHDSRLATFADRIVLLRDGRQVDPTCESSTMRAT
jgi:putative ABC transport system ATP-binding protein